tara:strand:+ start:3878 stop:4336 length:459 start_codon:yes stop_codon:yes gene_type:complete
MKDSTQRRKKRPDAGFTLTELLVVMVILSLLAAAVTPQVMGRLDRSKVRAAKLQINTLAASLDLFKIDTGRYPSEQEGLKALIEKPASIETWDGPYVRSGASLTDPWQREFIYRSASGTKDFVLVTFGADGKEGGKKYDSDIVWPDYTLAGQ